MDTDTRLRVARLALASRRLEERVLTLSKAGEVPGSLHMGAGQEVAQVAALCALRDDDPMLYGHRGVAYWVARGVPYEVILCDIAYREGGSNRGKGGPMHVIDPARGVLGETGSLGGNLVIGTGIAYAEMHFGSGRVAIIFFGDGTSNRGQFHEALNFASLRKLPVIYFCENNGWGLSVAASRSTAVADIADRAAGYAMPGVVVDGSNADDVYEAVLQAADRARGGHGPTLIEAKVNRLQAHYLGDRESYRTADERAALWEDDPLPRLLASIDPAAVERFETEIAVDIDRAVEYLRAQPLVSTASARESVYAS